MCAAVVFVIDSCHRDRLMEAHSELAKLLTEKELRDALLLIFANKQVLEYYPATADGHTTSWNRALRWLGEFLSSISSS